MVSAVYIASRLQRLDFDLRILRFFLVDPSNKKLRDNFIAAEAKDYADGMGRYLEQKQDRDELDDFLAPSICRRYERWVGDNLPFLLEFGESRLNQMELIIRYALLESFLFKIIGNIVWKHPQLLQKPIHKKMIQNGARKHLKRLTDNPSKEQIAKTRAVVDAADRLHFAKWEDEPDPKHPYLWQYLREGLDLEFGQKELCVPLEWTRRVRNDVVHHGLELTITPDRLNQMRLSTANFPLLLIQAAAISYPTACTQEPPEDDDDGVPGFVLAEKYY